MPTLAALPDLADAERWWREHVQPPLAGAADWFRITAEKKKPRTAEVWIYDRIGSDWFDEGVSAKKFAAQLRQLDVDEITLHLNSPGGDAFDGIAIFNTLRDHPAWLDVVVDGMAASAASFIAQAGNRVRMNKGSQMMIHRASGVVIGNANDMADFAEVLGKLDTSMAGIYAERAGGSIDEWLAAMSRETWYTAQETVDAGLADEVAEVKSAEPRATARFDLGRVFAYAGRDAAPAPAARARHRTPPASPGPSTTRGAGMDPVKLRESLGLNADASDGDVVAALAREGVVASAPPGPPPAPPTPPAPNPAGPNPPAPQPVPQPEPTPQVPPSATASGRVVVVDAKVWEETQRQVARVDDLIAERQREKRNAAIEAAIKAGKFPKSEQKQWEDLWDKGPQETERLLDTLTPGRVPMSPTGYVGADAADEAADDAIYDAMFPPHMRLGRQSRG